MKIQCKKPSRKQGSALVITLILGVILLVTLGSYLILISSQKGLMTRSQGWNAALTMAEAGVEEALAQMNASPNDFSANSWNASGGVYGPMAHNLIGGNYSVAIVGAATPTVYSTGYVTVPISGDKISRQVKVTALKLGLFNVALAAKHSINFNGNGINTDSWNSHDPNLSTGGQYNPSKTSTNGSVASIDGLVNIGNHTIDGNLYLGPTATFANSDNQVLGTIFKDSNMEFPDVVVPAASWLSAPVASASGTQTHTFTTSGNYTVIDNLPIIINTGVTVTLDVTTSGSFSSSVQILGGTTNSGTAYIYLNGPNSVSIAGNAGNSSNRPENLYYYGSPTLTDITYSGNSTFAGVIYAPEANLTLNGGGDNINLIGSSITGTVTMNGHYNFHYDESLATNGPSRGFVINSWQEL
jgi:hypothetical protein